MDGKLYLFSGKEGLEEDFDARARDVIAKADVKWPEIQQKEFNARQQWQLSIRLQPPTWGRGLRRTSLSDGKIPNGGRVRINVLVLRFGASSGVAVYWTAKLSAEQDC